MAVTTRIVFLGPLEDRLCCVAHLADEVRPEATGVPSRQTPLRANVPFATTAPPAAPTSLRHSICDIPDGRVFVSLCP